MAQTALYDIVLRQRVRDLLWNCDILLKPEYRKKKNRHPLEGHCYVASEALYHATGGPEGPYKPRFIRHEETPHWFLVNAQTGEVVDLTADQFTTPVPYDNAIGKGFLTKGPSKRAQQILNII